MPSFFVPARDSRHRAACFALYRALLRQVPHVSLPADVTSRSDWINPIRYLIRASFLRNKNDTSPRLVYSALQAGYNALARLSQAHDPSTPQHAEILAFLRERQARFPPPREPQPPAPRPPRVPLLTKISAPGERPVYKSTVRPLPLEQIKGGVRKVPVLDDANNMSFLRIGKPQSPGLSKFLHRAFVRRQKRITQLLEQWEDRQVDAEAEDEWDEMMEEIAIEQGVLNDEIAVDINEWQTSGKDIMGPFQSVVMEHGVGYLQLKLDEEAEHSAARAKAMLDIVDAEKALAEQEKQERKDKTFQAWLERQKLKDDQIQADRPVQENDQARGEEQAQGSRERRQKEGIETQEDDRKLE